MGLRMATTRTEADPFRNVKVVRGFELAGKESDGYWQIPADPSAREFPFEYCPPCRKGHNYQFRRNYEGLYPVESTGQMVWFESLVELSVLMQLDHEGDLIAISAQPFAILGPGYRHYLDFAALFKDGSRRAIDVRPAALVNAAAKEQFAVAGSVMEEIGIGYEVRHGPTGAARANLEWMSHFRQPCYSLASDAKSRLMRTASSAITLRDLAKATLPDDEARARVGIYHAMWRRELFPLGEGPINDRIKVTARQEEAS